MVIESWGELGGGWLAIVKVEGGYDLMFLNSDFDTEFFPAKGADFTDTLAQAQRAAAGIITKVCEYDEASHGY